jgi:hypothetical protein
VDAPGPAKYGGLTTLEREAAGEGTGGRPGAEPSDTEDTDKDEPGPALLDPPAAAAAAAAETDVVAAA